MMESLVKPLIEPLTSRWREAALGASALVWLALALLYLLSHPCSAHCASAAPWRRIAESRAVGPGLLIVAAVALVVATAFLVSAAADLLFAVLCSDGWVRGRRPVLRLGARLLAVQSGRRRRYALRIGRPFVLTADETRFGVEDRRLGQGSAAGSRRWPSARMTRLTACGNALAAVSERLEHHLGLDLTVVWRPLVATLPEDATARLSACSTTVLNRCRHLVAALAAAPLAGLLPWRYAGIWLACCAVGTVVFYLSTVAESRRFAEEVHCAVLLHRGGLYRALGVEPPAGAADDVTSGRLLSELLRSYEGRAPAPPVTYRW
ncbi:hypothetical protein [Streptomyces sp. NPDC046985]|uniref:hypothetical protein n=1 Tax=Streptomyces sp. NPDC046985 TaxID=3155377 RepID=UPI0033FFB8DC